MKNEIVKHIKFGEGKIIEVNEKYLKIVFTQAGQEKIFKYPEAFGKFLSFKKDKLQKEAEKAYETVSQETALQEGIKRKENEKVEEERHKEHLELLKKRRKASKSKTIKVIKKPVKKVNEIEKVQSENIVMDLQSLEDLYNQIENKTEV